MNLSFAAWCAWRLSEIRRALAEREQVFERRLIEAEYADRQAAIRRQAWSAARALGKLEVA